MRSRAVDGANLAADMIALGTKAASVGGLLHFRRGPYPEPPPVESRIDGPLRDSTGDGVTGFQHRRKISSILIRNTVVPTAIRTALGSCLAIEASYHRPTRSRYEQHPPGRSKAVRTAVGRSIFPADEIGRAQRQRPETTRPQLAAHRKAKEKPAGLSRRV